MMTTKRHLQLAHLFAAWGGAALLLAACDEKPRQETLQETGEVGKIGIPRPGQAAPAETGDTMARDEFRRTSVELDGAEDFEAEADIEEVARGVRFAISVEEGHAGRYDVFVYESGQCDQDPAKWGKQFSLGNPDTPLGQVQVEESGEGTARWLTERGNLREGDPETLIGKLVALYEPKGEESGKPVACGVVQLD